MVKIWEDNEPYNAGYSNYGDVDFFENGCLVNTEQSRTEFPMLICRPYGDEEDKFQFGDIVVDIDADWIDQEQIESFSAIRKEDDPVGYAISCVEYYGMENFGAQSYVYDYSFMTRQEIESILAARGVYTDSFRGYPSPATEYVCDMEKAVSDFFEAAEELSCTSGTEERVKYTDKAMDAAGRMFGGHVSVLNYPSAQRAVEDAVRGYCQPLTRTQAQRLVKSLARELALVKMLPATPQQDAFREMIYLKYNKDVMDAGGHPVRFNEFLGGPYINPISGVQMSMTPEERREYKKDPLVMSGEIYRKESSEKHRSKIM